jgi:tetratricopeptide (TPR) repeat protein
MTDFRFAKTVVEEHLVLSGRHCCLCEEHQGANVEVHHIIPKSAGGTRDFENAIVLCFKCHANVHAFATNSPKGRKYGPSELRKRRDRWYEKFKQPTPKVDHKQLARELLDQFTTQTPPPAGAAQPDTAELAEQATARTVQLLNEAVDLQRQHKEREAIDCLYGAFRRDLPPLAKSQLHLLLGSGYLRLSELKQAEGHYLDALSASRAAQDRAGEAAALGNLGLIYQDRGDPNRAEQYHQDALAINRKIGNRLGSAANLGNLGLIYQNRSDLDQAEKYHQQSLTIHHEIGDILGEAHQLDNIGLIHMSRGDLDSAERNLMAALAIHRELGDQLGEAQDLANLSLTSQGRGDYDRAEQQAKDALLIQREIGYRLGEAANLGNLGLIHKKLGDFAQAERFLKEALAIQKEIGDRLGEARQLANLGVVAALLGRRDEACGQLEQSAVIFEGIGARRELAMTRATLKELGCEEPIASESKPSE